MKIGRTSTGINTFLLNHFCSQRQSIFIRPNHNANLPTQSLGGWLTANVAPTNLASYVAAIIANDGFAEYLILDRRRALDFYNYNSITFFLN